MITHKIKSSKVKSNTNFCYRYFAEHAGRIGCMFSFVLHAQNEKSAPIGTIFVRRFFDIISQSRRECMWPNRNEHTHGHSVKTVINQPFPLVWCVCARETGEFGVVRMTDELVMNWVRTTAENKENSQPKFVLVEIF